MGFLELVQSFGLPLALCLAAIAWLVKLLRDILRGELMVPRYVYDELLERYKAQEKRLDRATSLAERSTYDVARPAVQKAKREDVD